MIEGETYQYRCWLQVWSWIDGNPVHNDIDNQCCPDFSCCQPELLISKEERLLFYEIAKEKGFECEEIMSMLIGYLGSALTEIQTRKEIYITGG